MPDQIISRNDLFAGQLVNKPEQATHILDASGDYLYVCPYCKNVASADDCDVIGAEPDCLFCNQCNREFKQ